MVTAQQLNRTRKFNTERFYIYILKISSLIIFRKYYIIIEFIIIIIIIINESVFAIVFNLYENLNLTKRRTEFVSKTLARDTKS